MLRASLRTGRDLSTSRRPAPKPDRRRLRHFALEPLEGRALLSLGTVAPATEITGTPDIAGSVAVGSLPSGITPDQMRKAYGLWQTDFYQLYTNGSGYNIQAGTGLGQTIAIVDPYNEPTLTSDLAAFDNAFNLPAPPSFQIVNENGQSSPLPGQGPVGSNTGLEEALDVEWAHVIAPQANIVLVEASSFNSIFTAINTARNISGVSVVSMSFGLSFNSQGVEDPSEVNFDSYFTTPSGSNGVTFVAASGDTGSYVPGTSTVSVNYPAASPNVVSVGGTNLTIGPFNSYGGETAWGNGTASNTLPPGGSGGGISLYEAHPAYQNGVEPSSTKRAVPDVSMDGGPGGSFDSRVAVYDATDFGSGGPWGEAYGTSLSAPMWAGIISVADQFRAYAGEAPLSSSSALQSIYSLPSTDFYDVTSGSNGAYSAGVHYDLVTGRGSPFANLLINDMVSTANSASFTGVLQSGHAIATPNGLYVLTMQAGDGNLVEYGPGNEVIWASNTGSTQNAGAYAWMQAADGNFVVYTNTTPATPLWASNTSNFNTNANATVNITFNGTMSINQTSGGVVWVANTYLAPGRILYPGQILYSPNLAYVLTMQDDGNLVLYTNTNPQNVVWASNTSGHPGAYADMQTDGNFVIYVGSTPTTFATNTSGHNNQGVQLKLLNTGHLVLVLNGQNIWTS
jgi:subtilase family serine protease